MKNIFFKTIAAAIVGIGLTGCVNDLDISSIDPQSSSSYEEEQLFAKCYGVLGLTGQRGGTGNGDLSDDEGESGFYRTTFNLQELPTDELMWAWQTDPDIPQITMIGWNSSSTRVLWAYTRLMYDITLFNKYLQEVPDNEEYSQKRAEIRFLRALHYWYLLDLFGKVPFKTDFDINQLPVEYSGAEAYDWIDKELTEIEPQMAEVGAFCNDQYFGRADRGAAYMLHARLALNSKVYTKGAVEDYQKAIDYCDQLINSGAYDLSRLAKNGNSGYAQLFMADNDVNTEARQEIIFPIRQDGLHTRQYGGSLMLIAGARSAAMPNYGMRESWTCLFARNAMISKFFENQDAIPLAEEAAPKDATSDEVVALDEQYGTTIQDLLDLAGDDRALFYSGCANGVRKLKTDKVSAFTDGLSVVKWTNLKSDNTAGQNVSWPDTDIPLFRLAEAYLTRAEAKYRLSGNPNDARADIQELHNRANADAVPANIDEMYILDEWCREFFMEGRRRSDLVRFDCFTGNKYVWDWKGGVENGISVDPHFNVYPIPAQHTLEAGNGNLTQNDGY
ncbi:starch-binding outer membrane lipoprotein SusD [Marseilla massiliensis]|uniref:Starch-binding outer membrane lipoprotein SusD n=1 Tax=Marseilla massiliensis TaxID=1841864 RepID=A0A938WUD3_9BACT|nr:starch-binding outer membrane lipoprotein SusD [Marseilla massiliensis]MBM6674309.1 starch-binding outer membrane lipoprotein SusD [Marseilla massiliensis]